MPHIQIIEDLTTGPIPPGSSVLVEFDPASQWYNAALTIAADWIKQDGSLYYYDYSQAPDNIRVKLQRLGVQVEVLERQDKLRIYDWYTCQMGQKSSEKFAVPSMKVADLSLWVLKDWMPKDPIPEVLEIADNPSAVARFNDEKPWIEYVLTRIVPSIHTTKNVILRGMMRGVHSDWANNQLEGAHQGIIDLELQEVSGHLRNLIRIRSMRDVGFDSQWHQLSINENMEVTLEK